MANVILKDENGDPIVYNNVTTVELPKADGSGKVAFSESSYADGNGVRY